jgi:hypothetical protein
MTQSGFAGIMFGLTVWENVVPFILRVPTHHFAHILKGTVPRGFQCNIKDSTVKRVLITAGNFIEHNYLKISTFLLVIRQRIVQ